MILLTEPSALCFEPPGMLCLFSQECIMGSGVSEKATLLQAQTLALLGHLKQNFTLSLLQIASHIFNLSLP